MARKCICRRCKQTVAGSRFRDFKVEKNEFGTYEDKHYIYNGKGFRIKKTGIKSIDNARRNPDVLEEIRRLVQK